MLSAALTGYWFAYVVLLTPLGYELPIASRALLAGSILLSWLFMVLLGIELDRVAVTVPRE